MTVALYFTNCRSSSSSLMLKLSWCPRQPGLVGVCFWWFSAERRFWVLRLKSQVCQWENQRKQGRLHEHWPCPRMSLVGMSRKQGKPHEHQPRPRRIPQECPGNRKSPMNISPVPGGSHRNVTVPWPPCPYWCTVGLGTEVFTVTSEAVPPSLLAGQGCHCPRAVLALPYQVACGTGDPRTVQVRVTSILSQTPCARSGIQNMGARPERSSRNSFSRLAFSIACGRETLGKGTAKG